MKFQQKLHKEALTRWWAVHIEPINIYTIGREVYDSRYDFNSPMNLKFTEFSVYIVYRYIFILSDQ